MGAGLVAARDEVGALGLDRLQRGDDVLRSLDAGRIALRPDQDEVVVHDGIALHAKAVGEELFFLRLGMDEHDVGIAAPGGVERLSGALRHHLHVDAGLRLEHRQDVAEQAGILRRGGRGDDDRFVLREGVARRTAKRRSRGDQKTALEHAFLRVFLPSDQQFAGEECFGLGGLRRCRRTPRRRRVSTMRPRCSSTISPASRRASPRSWVDITTLMPRSPRRG